MRSGRPRQLLARVDVLLDVVATPHRREPPGTLGGPRDARSDRRLMGCRRRAHAAARASPLRVPATPLFHPPTLSPTIARRVCGSAAHWTGAWPRTSRTRRFRPAPERLLRRIP